MKTLLIVVGIVFLVLGVFLYYQPLQASAVTTTGEVTRVSSASVQVPQVVAIAFVSIGLLLAIAGLLIRPAPLVHHDATVVQTTEKEVVSGNKGKKHTIVSRRREEYSDKV